MRGLDRGWLFVFLAAAGAVAIPGAHRATGSPVAVVQATSRRAPAGKPAKGSARAATTPPTTDEAEVMARMRDLLDDYLHFSPDEELEPAARRYRTAERGQIFALVATAPDPGETAFDEFFDQELDSIRVAARQARFLPDRFYLPWGAVSDEPDLDISVPGHPSGGLLDALPLRVTSHKDDAAARLPGMLLFRRPREPSGSRRAPPAGVESPPAIDLLVVFVVGESVTQGVRPQAFSTALKLVEQLAPPESRSRELLGPFFSASASAIRLALAAHQGCVGPTCSSTPYFALSGSATSDQLTVEALGSRNTFHTTNRPAGETHAAVREALHAPRIAELVEGTSWGNSFQKSLTPKKAAAGGQPEEKRAPSVTFFEFPLHIAELRSEHEKVKKGESADKTANLRTTLELRLDHGGPSSDDAPSHSALTPYDVELMLQQQLTTIARENFKFLGIVATDPADVIFLAGEARKYCPGVQLFALESSLLFTHPDVMRDLNGMIVASNYPLSSDRSFSADRNLVPRLSFASQVGEGIFNAAVGLLANMEATDGVAARHLLRDYHQTSGAFLPSTWITMVNNGAIWPLRIIDEVSDEYADDHAKQVRRTIIYAPPAAAATALAPPPELTFWRPRVGMFAESFYILLLLFTGIYLGTFFYRDAHGRNPERCLFPRAEVGLRLDRLRYLLGIYAPIALFCTYLTAVFRLLHVPRPRSESVSHSLGYLVFSHVERGLGLAVSTFAMSLVVRLLMDLPFQVRPLHRRRSDQWRSGSTTLLTALVAVGLSILTARYINSLWADGCSNPSTQIAISRTLQPLGGVSPALPLLFVALGLFCWGYFGLRRIERQERFPDATPFPSREGVSSVGLGDLAERIRATHTPGLVSVEHLFALATVGLLEGYFSLKLRGTLESPGFDPLFRASFLVLLALVVTNAGRLVAAWKELRCLLRRLAVHPMVDAYDRMGSNPPRTLGLDLGSPTRDHHDVETAVRSAAVLSRDPPPFAEPLRSAAYQKQLQLEAELLERIYIEDVEAGASASRIQTRAALFRLARTVFSILEDLWAGQDERGGTASFTRVITNDVSPGGALSSGPYRGVHTLALARQLAAPSAYLWQRLAEDFVAGEVTTLIDLALGRLRAMMTFVVVGALALVCVGGSYPFQPGRFMSVFTWLTALAALGGVLWLALGVERDEILSRLAHTRPGHVDLSGRFLVQIGVYAALPLAALVTTTFPTAGAVVVSWLEPILRALH